MDTIFSIYQLVDPRDNLPHYVGYTFSLERRLEQHLAGDSSHNVKKDAWLKELLSLGLDPLIQEIEVVRGTPADALARETYWIRRLTNEGMPLTNISGRVKPAGEKISCYLTKSQVEKLDDLAYDYKKHKGKRINRNDIVRSLIDHCTLESLEAM